MSAPTPSPKTDALFAPLLNALVANKDVFAQDAPDSRRIFHGRGHCFAGLHWVNIDYFAPVVFVTVYRTHDAIQPQPLRASSAEHHASDQEILVPALVQVLTDFFLAYPHVCVAVQRRDLPGAPTTCVVGALPQQPVARRGAYSFLLSFEQQNTGYFLDIEPARRWLDARSAGKRVLNLFSYTCAFSVVAAAGSADTVVNIDMSRSALGRGRDNHRLNKLNHTAVHFFGHDIFKSWSKLRRYGPYDIVIIDPPSFQKGSFIASKDYAKVIRKMPELVAESGEFLACLNAPEVHVDAFAAMVDGEAEGFERVEVLAVDAAFPELTPGHGLKMLVYKKS